MTNYRAALLSSLVVFAGCQEFADDPVVVDAEANDLGVSRVEIQRSEQGGERHLLVRGLDANGEEVASVAIRIGRVLYTSDPGIIPEEPADGSEIVFRIGDTTYPAIVVPDRTRHGRYLPPNQPELTAFTRIEAVAGAIRDEIGIWFIHRDEKETET